MDNPLQIRMNSLDILRGWCMIAILFFHSQMYYFGTDVVPYTLYVPNALALFYFISGFLAYREQQPVKTAMKRIALRLIMPYFIFATSISIVKMLIYFGTIDFRVLGSMVLSGRASWFVAALIIIELLFLVVRKITQDNTWGILLVALISVVGSYFLQRSPVIDTNFENGIPFALPPALVGLFFYCIGFLYHRHMLPCNPKPTSMGYVQRDGDEHRQLPSRAFTITYSWLIPTLVLFLIVKLFEAQKGYGFLFASLYADPFALFILDMLLGCVGISSLLLLLWQDTYMVEQDNSLKSKKESIYWFMSPAWIGMHCMVFYFFSGGVPLVVAFVLKKYVFSPDHHNTWCFDMGFWFTFLAVIVITSTIAWVIYRYLPFLLGRKVRVYDK